MPFYRRTVSVRALPAKERAQGQFAANQRTRLRRRRFGMAAIASFLTSKTASVPRVLLFFARSAHAGEFVGKSRAVYAMRGTPCPCEADFAGVRPGRQKEWNVPPARADAVFK